MSIYVRDADGNRQKIAGVGLPGPAGKSAYQYAVEGGFSGTEEEFRALMGVHSNDNLLDNANFRYPINQRGQTEYIGFGYTIDRWNTEGTTIKILSDGIQLENTSDTVASQFVSSFEASRLINGQIYTASLLAKDLIGSGTMVIQYLEGAFTYLLSAPLSDGLISVSGNLSTSGINLLGYMIVLHPNSSVKFIAAKLELGPVQTLAHKEGDNWVLNDPPPNKALELAKCQRYYRKGLLRYRRNPDYPSLFDPTADITPIPMRAGGVYTFTNLCNAYGDPLDATIQNIWVNPSGIAFPTIEVIGTGVPYMLSMDYEVSADL